MNKARRKVLSEVRDLLSNYVETLNNVRDEEQEAFDNMPEGLQESERGEKMQECIDNIDNAISSLEEVDEYLTEAIEP